MKQISKIKDFSFDDTFLELGTWEGWTFLFKWIKAKALILEDNNELVCLILNHLGVYMDFLVGLSELSSS